eukprot:scaffold22393_cov151-Isochrysis_galbana.AAC.3
MTPSPAEAPPNQPVACSSTLAADAAATAATHSICVGGSGVPDGDVGAGGGACAGPSFCPAIGGGKRKGWSRAASVAAASRTALTTHSDVAEPPVAREPGEASEEVSPTEMSDRGQPRAKEAACPGGGRRMCLQVQARE